jgi:DNA-binding response OmpR family regulator
MSTVARTQSNAPQPVVLVVEDDPTLNSALCYNLRRSGFETVPTTDGETALTSFRDRRHDISLIILDLMLPRIPGQHVLRIVRQSSSVPVLIVSARGQEADIVDALDLGADDYIVKPFAIGELMARIRALLRRNSAARGISSVVQRGPIRIDSVGLRAWVGDTELSLRPKEFGLLVTMAVTAGKVFSRQELLDSVWGEEVVVDDRTVDVHVSWLRGKLRRAGIGEDPIETAYGSGYRFVTPAGRPTSQQSEFLRPDGGGIQPGQAAGRSLGQPKEWYS